MWLNPFMIARAYGATSTLSAVIGAWSECVGAGLRCQPRRFRRLHPVILATKFSRCHCSGPRPWVQPQRR